MSRIAIYLLSIYQKYVSFIFGNRCRFYPSCSEYSKQAIEKYGVLKGLMLSTGRLIRCNQLFPGGVDLLK